MAEPLSTHDLWQLQQANLESGIAAALPVRLPGFAETQETLRAKAKERRGQFLSVPREPFVKQAEKAMETSPAAQLALEMEIQARVAAGESPEDAMKKAWESVRNRIARIMHENEVERRQTIINQMQRENPFDRLSTREAFIFSRGVLPEHQRSALGYWSGALRRGAGFEHWGRFQVMKYLNELDRKRRQQQKQQQDQEARQITLRRAASRFEKLPVQSALANLLGFGVIRQDPKTGQWRLASNWSDAIRQIAGGNRQMQEAMHAVVASLTTNPELFWQAAPESVVSLAKQRGFSGAQLALGQFAVSHKELPDIPADLYDRAWGALTTIVQVRPEGWVLPEDWRERVKAAAGDNVLLEDAMVKLVGLWSRSPSKLKGLVSYVKATPPKLITPAESRRSQQQQAGDVAGIIRTVRGVVRYGRRHPQYRQVESALRQALKGDPAALSQFPRDALHEAIQRVQASRMMESGEKAAVIQVLTALDRAWDALGAGSSDPRVAAAGVQAAEQLQPGFGKRLAAAQQQAARQKQLQQRDVELEIQRQRLAALQREQAGVDPRVVQQNAEAMAQASPNAPSYYVREKAEEAAASASSTKAERDVEMVSSTIRGLKARGSTGGLTDPAFEQAARGAFASWDRLADFASRLMPASDQERENIMSALGAAAADSAKRLDFTDSRQAARGFGPILALMALSLDAPDEDLKEEARELLIETLAQSLASKWEQEGLDSEQARAAAVRALNNLVTISMYGARAPQMRDEIVGLGKQVAGRARELYQIRATKAKQAQYYLPPNFIPPH